MKEEEEKKNKEKTQHDYLRKAVNIWFSELSATKPTTLSFSFTNQSS
jgi:hypothetical protein